MAYLIHPNVVHLEDLVTDSRNFYLVQELVTGSDLGDYIHKSKSQCHERVIAGLFWQIVSGLQYCHSRGVAHRDLKPQNILLTERNEVRITDFGLCHFKSTDSAMTTLCGTAAYLAPECLKPQRYDGFARDIWSLGIILYEMMTRSYPWTASNGPLLFNQIASGKVTIPPGISSGCRDLIKRMLRVRPSDRPTASDILASNWFKFAPTRSGIRMSVSGPSLCDLAAALEKEDPSESGIVSPFLESPRVKSPIPGDEIPRLKFPRICSARGRPLERTALSPAEAASKRFRGQVLKW
jgi:5'-AMP-activated protein kinase catalytic alpha subunit